MYKSLCLYAALVTLDVNKTCPSPLKEELLWQFRIASQFWLIWTILSFNLWTCSVSGLHIIVIVPHCLMAHGGASHAATYLDPHFHHVIHTCILSLLQFSLTTLSLSSAILHHNSITVHVKFVARSGL